MTKLPHDVADLYLAPVALAVDTRITELSCLTDEKLALRGSSPTSQTGRSICARTRYCAR